MPPTEADHDGPDASGGIGEYKNSTPAPPRQRDLASLAGDIARLGPNDFTREVMQGVARLLQDRDNPLRLNLFAVSIRIYLDHVMDALAPQAQVEACRWFKPVEDQNKPVRAQRLGYALRGGFTETEIKELTGIEVAELVSEVMDAYRTLNKHVHGREETIVRDVGDQDSIIEEILLSLAVLLEEYHDFRRLIASAIVDGFQAEAVSAFTTETIGELDILATHHTVDWVGVAEHWVVGIDATHIEYEISGSIGVTLLYGSGSDRARGDGAEIHDEFPISMRFRMPVEHPHDFGEADVTSGVDTSGWFDDGDDEDIRSDDADLPNAF